MTPVAIIVITGDGTPKLYTTGGDVAHDEAYDLLKRGVLGHFQFIPASAEDLTYTANLLETQQTNT